MKVTVMVEMSRDGYIAGPDGDLSLFKKAHTAVVPPGETMGFREYLAQVDAVVMGRKTFDSIKHMPKWWYGDLPIYILSRDPSRVSIPEPLATKDISPMNGEPQQVLDTLVATKGIRRIHLDGGASVFHAFMDANLIDQVTVITMPIDFCRGTPFLSDKHWARLKVKEETKYDFGFTKTTYSVRKNE